ncbi:hypothetical protein HanRHA438_Chr06g0272261 [Helianthus annuus]|nr:hypothetical protein HanRHA438_Chr06g0272261 [Helianthus annuus]
MGTNTRNQSLRVGSTTTSYVFTPLLGSDDGWTWRRSRTLRRQRFTVPSFRVTRSIAGPASESKIRNFQGKDREFGALGADSIER